jgi:hypothetical protein
MKRRPKRNPAFRSRSFGHPEGQYHSPALRSHTRPLLPARANPPPRRRNHRTPTLPRPHTQLPHRLRHRKSPPLPIPAQAIPRLPVQPHPDIRRIKEELREPLARRSPPPQRPPLQRNPGANPLARRTVLVNRRRGHLRRGEPTPRRRRNRAGHTACRPAKAADRLRNRQVAVLRAICVQPLPGIPVQPYLNAAIRHRGCARIQWISFFHATL